MKFNRKDLINKLLLVRPGLSKKEIIESSTHFIFTGTHLCTYNDQISIKCPLDTDFQCTLVADKFYNLLSSLDDETIDMEIKKNQFLINGKETKSGLTIIDKNNVIYDLLKELELDQKQKWILLPDNFISGLSLCSFSVSKDIYSGAFNCACINDNHIFSTDNLRISKFEMSKSINNQILLPLRVIRELIKYDVKKMIINRNNNWIYFSTLEDIIFCTKMQTGDFPIDDIKTLFDEEKNDVSIEFPTKISDLIKTVSSIITDVNDMDKKMIINIKKGKIACRIESENGWSERETTINYKGNDLQLLINPVFLSQILNKSCKFSISDNQGHVVFNAEYFNHIIMLEGE